MKQKIIAVISTLAIITMIYFSATSETKVVVTADTSENVVVDTEEKIFVEIKGAIISPGIYEVEKGTRLFEVIELASGLADDANVDYINQTRVLQDQSLIMILTNAEIEAKIEEEKIEEYEESIVEVATTQSTIIGADNCSENNATSEDGNSTISINTSTVEELMSLPGIGESKALEIVSYRDNNGGFKNLEELQNVSGIGEATFNKIKALISL